MLALVPEPPGADANIGFGRNPMLSVSVAVVQGVGVWRTGARREAFCVECREAGFAGSRLIMPVVLTITASAGILAATVRIASSRLIEYVSDTLLCNV